MFVILFICPSIAYERFSIFPVFALFQYAVVELAVDSISDEDETEPKIFACIAASTWLSNVTRAILEDIIKYHGDLVWPDNEAELQPFLQKPHSKPPNHWAIHHRVRILKFCGKLPCYFSSPFCVSLQLMLFQSL